MKRNAFALTVALAMIATACTQGPTTTPSPSPSGTTTTSPAPAMTLPMVASGFGQLPSIPLITDTPAYVGPSTPHSLTGVDMTDALRSWMSDPAILDAIERHGFVVLPTDPADPSGIRLFWHIYEQVSYDQGTVYVTTDVGYHYWHLLFDKVLRALEQDVFLPKLRTLAAGMLSGAQAQEQGLRGSALGTDAARVLGLMQVEAAL
ncbi:MAG TPA: DUF3160 domain-containing protein, partial [Actinomycetota bacterium]